MFKVGEEIYYNTNEIPVKIFIKIDSLINLDVSQGRVKENTKMYEFYMVPGNFEKYQNKWFVSLEC